MQGTRIQSPAGELGSHMPWDSWACAPQLERSPHATTVESMGSGAPVPQLERSPHAKTETPSTAAETQRSQKQVNAQSA